MKINMPYKIVPLSEVVYFQEGPGLRNWQYANEGIPFLNIRTLTDEGFINKSLCQCVKKEEFTNKYEHFLLDEGDFVVSSSGTLGKLAEVRKQDLPIMLNTSVIRFRPLDTNILDRDFLKWFIKSPLYFRQIESASTGTAIKNYGPSHLKKMVIPLPPIASQRRIANILDKADEIIRKRKEAIALTEQLQKSIFLDMFGDPVINPKGWEVNKVIDYCDCIVPGRDKPKSFTGSIPWITTADLKFLDKTYFSNLNMKLSENEIKEVNAKIIPKNSVLLTCVGDLGVTSIAGCDMVVNQQLHSFQCKNINNYFLMYALPYQKIFMYKRATQTTVPYMNKNTCNSIPIIYPPRKLQEKFGILIAEINNKKGLYLKALQESENLFNSLLQKAFKGEL